MRAELAEEETYEHGEAEGEAFVALAVRVFRHVSLGVPAAPQGICVCAHLLHELRHGVVGEEGVDEVALVRAVAERVVLALDASALQLLGVRRPVEFQGVVQGRGARRGRSKHLPLVGSSHGGSSMQGVCRMGTNERRHRTSHH